MRLRSGRRCNPRKEHAGELCQQASQGDSAFSYGDFVPTIRWGFRGPRPRPPMEWRQASGAPLNNHTCSATFALSQPPGQDDIVPGDQIGFEIRFHWRGRFRCELGFL